MSAANPSRAGDTRATTVLLLHQFEHGARHSNDPNTDRWFGNGREFARMQGWQFFSRLLVLRDLRRLDCSEMKINRRDGVVRQTVFGKIVTAHRWIDDLDIVVA